MNGIRIQEKKGIDDDDDAGPRDLAGNV